MCPELRSGETNEDSEVPLNNENNCVGKRNFIWGAHLTHDWLMNVICFVYFISFLLHLF